MPAEDSGRHQRRRWAARVPSVQAELVEVGVEAVSTASRDVLCVMAVQTAAYEGVDVNTEVEAGEETDDRWLLGAARDGLV
jgi:hypothetical protein